MGKSLPALLFQKVTAGKNQETSDFNEAGV
jgi:hypothetical protein